MNLRYLLDTDWAINYLHGDAGTAARVSELGAQGIGLSVISLAELYEGVYYSSDPPERERGLHHFLRMFTFLGVDEETCKVFARERGRLRSKRRLISDFDLLISATALRHDLVLLTNNRRHFEMIEGLQLVSQ